MSADLVAAKRRLRTRMAVRRRRVEPRDATRAAERAAQALVGLDCVRAAPRVGLYAALPDELPTRVLFDAVVALGAIPLFPRTRTASALEFCVVESWDALVAGAHGVLEPPRDRPAQRFDREDVVIVPGVAFDALGHRLGRGAGYYDRSFPAECTTAPVLIGYGYEFQVIERLPHAAHDRRMDAVVTETAVRRCR